MALSADALYTRRGSAKPHNEFGYPVAPGEKIYRGALIGVNASSQIVRLQDSEVACIGLADRQLDNSTSSAPSAISVVGLKGTWQITVPSAAPANIGAPVYASDDATVTLTQNGAAPFLPQIGTLVGIENGNTFVAIAGS